jgi:predicted methyltransferase
MNPPFILSHIQLEPILHARREGQTHATTSLDLGLTSAEVMLNADHIRLPDGQMLTWDVLARIEKSDNACFAIEDNNATRIQVFSESMQRLHTLMPTSGAPTMLIAGLPMHRIKDIDPHADTLLKLRALSPIRGTVLDTATGLGYTAIEAAKTAERVITVEIDPASIAIARLNPWSQALFDHPKIQPIIGDVFDEVAAFEEGAFSCIIHDPPTLSLAGDLYSEEFYRELYRVLKRRGRLFHYIGDLDSAAGRRVSKGVARRLQTAGFQRVRRRPEAFGLLAHK